MKYVFGPVPSRRLGQSLGIDTIPLKTCNWNCVYCQLGRTRRLVNERREYYSCAEILAEVWEALEANQPGAIDWVTFVGSGEPLLHSGMGRLIEQVKGMTDLSVAVITNGSLLYKSEVRQELARADAVLPSLDAGSSRLYLRINRPHPSLTFERLLDGLIAFRDDYRGKLWVEVMMVSGMNDSTEALEDIASVLQRIQPDVVHLTLPTRAPAEDWVQPSGEESVLRALAILSKKARVTHPSAGSFDLRQAKNVVEAVIGIITRHPMRQDELECALARWGAEDVQAALSELEASGQAQVVERYGVRFWTGAPARY
jgi:wyosine [tRNA(Phe)-imidazoG37] synthetase (radical SAM superfamily)